MEFLPATKPRKSMYGKMSAGGTGVVHFLGIFCKYSARFPCHGRSILGGVATCSEGFVKCFLRVPRLLGCTAAAVLPKQARGTFRKHTGICYKRKFVSKCVYVSGGWYVSEEVTP